MAELVIAGWFASSAVAKLYESVKYYINEQYEYQRGVKDKLKKLETNLQKISAVVHSASGEISNPELVKWLRRLKDAVHAGEDMFDRFSYQLMQDKVIKLAKGEQQVHRAYLRRFKRARRVLMGFVFSDRELNQLRKLNDDFDGLVRSMNIFLHLLHDPMVIDTPADTISDSLVTDELIGRENEREKLISLIENGDTSTRINNIGVISIVGIAGVGKTALVQSVFDKVENLFHVKAWISMPKTFSLRRIMIEIIESSPINRPVDLHNLSNLNVIKNILQKGLEGQSTLVVLDGVDNVDTRKWDNLYAAFKLVKPGSKIVVTTQDPNVAALISTTNNTVHLKGLSHLAYWNLFRRCAFGDLSFGDYRRLEILGKCIVMRLGGSPLAAKTIGAILRRRLTEEHWKEVNDELWKVKKDKNEIMPTLRLNYDNQAPNLKQCLVYCSFFPKGYAFEKDILVQMWMAQGFIQGNEGEQTPEGIGRRYFDELLDNSFFHDAGFGSKNSAFYLKLQALECSAPKYILNSLLTDLAEIICPGEYFTLQGDLFVQIPETVYHLSVSDIHLANVFEKLRKIKTLRSLILLGGRRSDPATDYKHVSLILKELTSLRVLQLSCFDIEGLPETVGCLRHLRFLDLSNCTKIQVLPDSLCTLYHLQLLNFGGCYELRSLPNKISNLINLRYLRGDLTSVAMIACIGKLTLLQELKEYHVGRAIGHGIGQLKDMNELRGQLRIRHLENVWSWQKAREAMLYNKRHINSLQLEWSLQQGPVCFNPEVVLEGLEPNQNLRRLKITGFSGVRFPNWFFFLHNLNYIRIENALYLASVTPLGQLPYLKTLHISSATTIKRIGPEFYGYYGNFVVVFPMLEELLLEDMEGLVEWQAAEAEESLSSFPRLRRLHIVKCQQLKNLLPIYSAEKMVVKVYPPGIMPGHEQILDSLPADGESPSCFHLCIDDTSLLSRCFPETLRELEFWSCSQLNHFTTGLERWLQRLVFLQKLSFIQCDSLRTLPVGLKSLESLEILLIKDCPVITSLSEKDLPPMCKLIYQ